MNEQTTRKISNILAYYFDFLVLVSLVGLCCQTLPSLRRYHLAWFLFETIISGQFAVRLLVRMISCPDLKEHLMSWSFWSDLVCIAPWPVELYIFLERGIGGMSASVRFLRVLRFIRVAQCSCFRIPEMRLFSRALRRSRPAFLFLAAYGSVALLCFAWTIFLVETAHCRIHEGVLWKLKDMSIKCPLQNMFESIWLCLCTVMTVGYGDFVPESPAAKVLVSVMMVGSFVMLPLPIAIFGANLTELYVEGRLKRRQERGIEPETDLEEKYNTIM